MDEQEATVNTESESTNKGRRIRRSLEERLSAIDEKIAAENARHMKAIAKLEEAKKNLTKPRMTKKEKSKVIIEQALKNHTPEELAEMLGIDTSDLFS